MSDTPEPSSKAPVPAVTEAPNKEWTFQRSSMAAPDVRPLGRPSKFTRELADRICAELEKGKTLRQVCRDEKFPPESTVRTWASNNIGKTDETVTDGTEPYGGFFAQYTRAREIGYHCMADELVDIVDDGTNDWITEESMSGRITMKLDHEHVKRSALRADTRKWLLSKALPKIFGDKLDLNVNGTKPQMPNASEDMTEEQAREVYNALRSRKG